MTTNGTLHQQWHRWFNGSQLYHWIKHLQSHNNPLTELGFPQGLFYLCMTESQGLTGQYTTQLLYN